ncbi:hypothetical protein IWW54_000328 [Coemansia sp. RSA 2705]|nr:hypothetical protein IWW54_000328 [Coemansia sp. RSA 2705]
MVSSPSALSSLSSPPPPAHASILPGITCLEDADRSVSSRRGPAGTDKPVQTFVSIRRPEKSSDDAGNAFASSIGPSGNAAVPVFDEWRLAAPHKQYLF